MIEEDHYEMWDSRISLYKRRLKWLGKGPYSSRSAFISVPMRIVDHLRLEHKDELVVAIRRKDELKEAKK